MARPHLKSNLSISKSPIPVDKNTILMCHYDISTISTNGIEPTTDTSVLTGMNQRVTPNGTIYDGKYGGAVTLEEATTNIMPNGDFSNGTTSWSIVSGGDPMNNTYSVREESGKKYLHVHWERISGSGNTWPFIKGTTRYTTPGTYTLSCEVRINGQSGDTAEVRHAAIDNDYGTDGRIAWGFGGKQLGVWHKVVLTRTFNATHVIGGVTKDLSASFELYSGSLDVIGEYVDFDIREIQIEQKSFKTSFVNGTRDAGNLTYPINIAGDFTISFWCKFDYEWYKNIISYNKILLQMWDTTTNSHIDYTDYAGALNTNNNFFNLEPDANWDSIMHHWHSTFNYSKDTWYFINIIKLGSTLSRVIYDNSGTVVSNNLFTYSDSTKLQDFNFNEIRFKSEWSTIIDELRIDKVARSSEEILSWYISKCPFYAKERYKLVR